MATTLNKIMAREMLTAIRNRKIARELTDFVDVKPADLGMDEVKPINVDDILYH